MVRLEVAWLLMLVNVRLNIPWNMLLFETNEEMGFPLECLPGEMERPRYL